MDQQLNVCEGVVDEPGPVTVSLASVAVWDGEEVPVSVDRPGK